VSSLDLEDSSTEPDPGTAAVRRALASVFDPCSVVANAPLNILEMGIVTECRLDGGGVAHITLNPTSPTCEMMGSIALAVDDAVSRVPGVAAVELTLDPVQVWTPERMTAPARARLAARRAESLRLVPVRPRQWQLLGPPSAGRPMHQSTSSSQS
jgi:metal-sulfur cluster biosynthetic enzyme